MAKNLLGKSVVYTDSQGLEKAALIVGTPESITEGTEIPVPPLGTVHLKVEPPTGKPYIRHNIAEGNGPQTYACR